MANQGNEGIHNPFGNTQQLGETFEKVTGVNSGMATAAGEVLKTQLMSKINVGYEQNKGYLSFCSLEAFKIYFDVTNKYVLHKLKIILFPFLLKEDDWKRGLTNPYATETFQGAQEEEEDLNTPKNDL